MGPLLLFLCLKVPATEKNNDIMTEIATFVFSPFSENTYILYDESGEAVIVDPGQYDEAEREELNSFLTDKGLKLVLQVYTHGHIDHVCGSSFVMEDHGAKAVCHMDDLDLLKDSMKHAAVYGFEMREPVLPASYLKDGDSLEFGKSRLEVKHAPGHSRGHIVLYSSSGKFLLSGDVLFRGSIGRTDLPGGDYDTLINSIRSRLMDLPGETIVYPGHGPETSIEYERNSNPFLH